jgi:putative membrane protein
LLEISMALAATVVTALIALPHLYMVLALFLWDKPVGRRAFGMSLEQAQATKTLAAIQGLYNGFLAAGLRGAVVGRRRGLAVQRFFLGCVLAAGLYGAATANRKILWIQAVPAALALLLGGAGPAAAAA